ncbi:hypothetical protein RRG08_049155 [Elysia crispata]|uniref:Uncharacterized protein n=1 Tax=Elysia crispata TaxID=231223 RepID=A0AAE1ASC8_9GAST|nr:hypothetical protein RRG08_049155 [Elysia crispata]
MVLSAGNMLQLRELTAQVCPWRHATSFYPGQLQSACPCHRANVGLRGECPLDLVGFLSQLSVSKTRSSQIGISLLFQPTPVWLGREWKCGNRQLFRSTALLQHIYPHQRRADRANQNRWHSGETRPTGPNKSLLWSISGIFILIRGGQIEPSKTGGTVARHGQPDLTNRYSVSPRASRVCAGSVMASDMLEHDSLLCASIMCRAVSNRVILAPSCMLHRCTGLPPTAGLRD